MTTTNVLNLSLLKEIFVGCIKYARPNESHEANEKLIFEDYENKFITKQAAYLLISDMIKHANKNMNKIIDNNPQCNIITATHVKQTIRRSQDAFNTQANQTIRE